MRASPSVVRCDSSRWTPGATHRTQEWHMLARGVGVRVLDEVEERSDGFHILESVGLA